MSANSGTSDGGETRGEDYQGAILLHGLGGSPSRRLAAAIGDGLPIMGRFRPIVGSFDRAVVALSGDLERIGGAGAGLRAGAAHAEAVAVRLRRDGVPLEWGAPRPVDTARDLFELCRARGASSVALLRADPTLVTELQIGGWFDADWRLRVLRRVTLRLPWTLVRLSLSSKATGIRLAADISFWRGARAAATDVEWRRLTASSYVALVYHRLAGESKQGQETIDLEPKRFARQLRILRSLRFRPLQPLDVIAFHGDSAAVLARRSFVVTFDDGTADCFEPLLRQGRLGAQLFVPTREVGGRAHWLADEPLITWEDARALEAAGTHIGSHAQHHRRLVGRDFAELVQELEASLSDLRAGVESPIDVIAFPHGAIDLDVRRAAQASAFRAAYTTAKGRNGAGTDVFCLRRVSVHAADGALAILWKVVTGEGLPRRWLWLRSRQPKMAEAAGRLGRRRA